MDKLAALRIITHHRPGIAEQVITLWGSSEFQPFLGLAIAESSHSRAGATEEIVQAMAALVQIHLSEFPQHAALQLSVVNDKLSGNENFRIINDRFPHIGAKILATWGRPAFHEYISTLLNDTRDGKRKGFPEEVALAIFHLTQEHEAEHPSAVVKGSDPWDDFQRA